VDPENLPLHPRGSLDILHPSMGFHPKEFLPRDPGREGSILSQLLPFG
jgi:hypothetical protein